MFFHRKKEVHLPHIQLFSKEVCLYDGLIKDIPLKDCIIIEKSILFFDDPEPCNIHRTAVRVRLTEELCRNLDKLSQDEGCRQLEVLTPFASIDSYITKDLELDK